MGLNDKKSELKRTLGIIKIILNSDAFDLASEFGPGFKDPLGRDRQKDLIPFLMDLISLLIGGQRLEQMLTNLIGSQIEEIDKSIRDTLRDQLKAKCGEAVLNSGFPSWLGGGGLEIELVNLDMFDMLKMAQGMGGSAGDFADGMLGKVDSFNRKIMEAVENLNSNFSIDTTAMGGAPQQLLTVTYTGGGFIFELGVDYTNKTVENFIDDYFDSLIILDAEILTTMIMNFLTGIFDKQADLSVDAIAAQLQMDAIATRMAGADCGEIVDEESRFFKFSREELILFRQKAEERKNGTVSWDLNCGTVTNEVNLTKATEVISNFSANQSQLYITNQQRMANAQTFLNDMVYMMLTNSQLQTGNASPEAIRDDIMSSLIDQLKNMFLRQTLTPQTLVMILLVAYALVDDSELDDQGYGQPKKINLGPERLEIFGELRGSIREIVKLLYEIILKLLFENVGRAIRNFMLRIAADILKEKLRMWTQAIKATFAKGKLKIAQRTKRIF